MALRVHYGCDPGAAGAISFFEDGELKRVTRIPVSVTSAKRNGAGKITIKGKTDLDLAALVAMLRFSIQSNVGASFSATIERVGENAMPQQPGQPSGGMMSLARLAGTAGEVRGILAAMGVPFDRVQPAVWKRHFGLGKDKDAVRRRAQAMWPWLDLKYKNQADLAEAALIGAYGLIKAGDHDVIR